MFEEKHHIIAAHEGNSTALQLAGTSDCGKPDFYAKIQGSEMPQTPFISR